MVCLLFLEQNTIVYSGATSPVSMELSDSIPGVGCVDRKTVQSIGSDLLFLSQDGLRSLGRAVQEKSLPISDLSRNVKQDLIDQYRLKLALDFVYSPENYFYLLGMVDSTTVYCFDLRGLGNVISCN